MGAKKLLLGCLLTSMILFMWDKVRSGQVVICRLMDGRSFIKQFKIIDGQMMLFSSKNYDPIPIRKETVDVLHKVIWVKMP